MTPTAQFILSVLSTMVGVLIGNAVVAWYRKKP